ncbi:MAG: DJ-1/PfpI/YhbO family deglycase/protease [Phycisphaerae bacterium]
MKTMRLVVLAAMLTALGGCGNENGSMDNTADSHKPLAGMKVAVLTGDDFQHEEALMPLAHLTNRGAEVTVIGPRTGKVKSYSADVSLLVEKAAAAADPADYDALVLPGGKAPAAIRKNQAVVDFARTMYKSGKPVAAICHGPQVLVTAGVVEDRQMTCYSGVSEELKEAGAVYYDRPVVRDQNLVTSRVPKDIPQWLDAMEEMFLEHRSR